MIREMIDHHRASLSKQHTTGFIAHGPCMQVCCQPSLISRLLLTKNGNNTIVSQVSYIAWAKLHTQTMRWISAMHEYHLCMSLT